MNKSIIPIKEFTLAKRNIINTITVDQYLRFNVEHSILYKMDIPDDRLKKFHEKERLLYGNRIYVLIHSVDREIDRGINTYEIFVPEDKYIEIIQEFIKFKQSVVEHMQDGVRRIKKTDNPDMAISIIGRRKAIKIVNKEIEILEEIKMKLIKKFSCKE